MKMSAAADRRKPITRTDLSEFLVGNNQNTDEDSLRKTPRGKDRDF